MHPSTDILTVNQLNCRAKRLLESEFPTVWVAGELSNLAFPSSGHWYFTLKDDAAQVRCAMFRQRNTRLTWQPQSGQQVVVRASMSLFAARGDYQLIVEHITLAGDGALALAVEQLKNKLYQEGLFDQQTKKPLPAIPHHIAVVSSPTGAVIHDVLTVLARRFPAIAVSIFPTAVQGADAAATITAAIARANSLAQLKTTDDYNFDALLLARGGGSLEDLQAFNSEMVARAIAASQLPVVSAIGHEVDVTIADLVADVRAPTPSAAAELLSPNADDYRYTINHYQQRLYKASQRQLLQSQQRLQWLTARLRHPKHQLREYGQRCDAAQLCLHNAWWRKYQQLSYTVTLLSGRLQQCCPAQRVALLTALTTRLHRALIRAIMRYLDKQQTRLRSIAQQLDTVSPLPTLARGYAIVSDAQGKLLRRSSDVKRGESIVVRLSQGRLLATVDKCLEE